MKVYVIQKGKYADRHIIGVTTDKEEAEKIARIVSGKSIYSKADVTEYDTNQFYTGIFKFRVQNYTGWDADYCEYPIYDEYTENTKIGDGLYIIFAKNAEEAIEIAKKMEGDYEKLD